MNRSKDLDNIAPDDPIFTEQKPKISVFDQNLDQSSTKTINTSDIPDKNSSFKQNVYNLLGHSKSSFSNFLVNPKVLNFAEQDDDETIYLAVRPHLISNLSWIATSLIMLIVPFFFSYFSFLNFLPLRYRFSSIFFWKIFIVVF